MIVWCHLDQGKFAIERDAFVIEKQYKFKLNYKKCHFLKEKIKYLGYILLPSGELL